MKKVIVIMGLSVLAVSIAFSQSNTWKKGIHGGVNLSNYQGQFNNELLGFTIGGFAEKALANHWKIHSELNYSLKRGYVSYTYRYAVDNKIVDSFGVRPEAAMSTVSIPILLQYTLLKKITIEAGPQFSYLLHSSFVDKYSERPILYASDNFNKAQLHASVGINYKLNERLTLFCRYEKGLTNALKHFSIEMNTLSLQLKYYLN